MEVILEFTMDAYGLLLGHYCPRYSLLLLVIVWKKGCYSLDAFYIAA